MKPSIGKGILCATLIAAPFWAAVGYEIDQATTSDATPACHATFTISGLEATAHPNQGCGSGFEFTSWQLPNPSGNTGETIVDRVYGPPWTVRLPACRYQLDFRQIGGHIVSATVGGTTCGTTTTTSTPPSTVSTTTVTTTPTSTPSTSVAASTTTTPTSTPPTTATLVPSAGAPPTSTIPPAPVPPIQPAIGKVTG